MGKKNRGALSSSVDINGVLHKRKSRSESDDDLSYIDEAGITGYLNNKTEMLFKKLVWEAVNKDYLKAAAGLSPENYEASPAEVLKKQRKPARGKKSTSAKTAVLSRMEKGKEAEKENRKRLSLKINYDALEELTNEAEGVTETAKKVGIDSNRSKQIETQQPKGASSLEGFEEDNYSEEFQPEVANLSSYRDEEEEEYGYRQDYDYEGF